MISLETRLQVIVANYPKGTSAPNLVHYGLNVRSPKFEFLDYMDSDTNMLCYNQTTPPIVPLEKITLEDIHLFNSENDALADPEDVERLKNALKGCGYLRVGEFALLKLKSFLFNSEIRIQES